MSTCGRLQQGTDGLLLLGAMRGVGIRGSLNAEC
jgi:hypothetical protein